MSAGEPLVPTSRCRWCGRTLYLHGSEWGDQPHAGQNGRPLVASMICPSLDPEASFFHESEGA